MNTQMKAVKIERDNEKPLMKIETETPTTFLGFRVGSTRRTFVSVKQYAKGYWKWVELPNYTPVSNHVSFQLDTFLEYENV